MDGDTRDQGVMDEMRVSSAVGERPCLHSHFILQNKTIFIFYCTVSVWILWDTSLWVFSDYTL